MRTIRGNLLAFLLGLAGAILLGEAILQAHYRLTNGRWLCRSQDIFVIDYIAPAPDRREYTLKPGYAAKGLSVNKDGFRGKPIPPGDRAPLICVLGDSVPFGVEVRDEQAYPFLLQAELRKSGRRVNVLNAGVPSYNLRQAFERFRYEIAPRYRPALVIVQAANDVMLLTHYREKWTPDVTWATVRMKGGLDGSGFLARCALYHYAAAAAGIFPGREKEFHREHAPDRMAEGVRETLVEQLAYFRRLDIPVILLPNDPFYYSGPDKNLNRKLKRWQEFAFYHRIWSRLVDRYNEVLAQAAVPGQRIYFFDSRTTMDARGREGLYADFIHLSPAGNALLAKALAEFIRREGLLEQPDNDEKP